MEEAELVKFRDALVQFRSAPQPETTPSQAAAAPDAATAAAGTGDRYAASDEALHAAPRTAAAPLVTSAFAKTAAHMLGSYGQGSP